MIEIITSKDIENMYLTNDSGIFTPLFTYELYNEETDTYVGFKITKTAEQVYQEWLEQKDLPPKPSEMEIIKQKVFLLEESQQVQDLLIDDIVFEVIPTLESQIGSQSSTTVLNNKLSSLNKIKGDGQGMAGYLARKIIEGRDYATVFKTNSYKQYQDEVDTILELEGRGDLIKR